ncbi:MAG: hypothetical protein ACXITV_02730 [Luteibaculaceae bacterium]
MESKVLEENSIKILLKEQAVIALITAGFLFAFFWADGLQKFLIRYDYPFSKVTIFLRGASLVFYLGICIFFLNRERLNVLSTCLILICTWFVGKLSMVLFTDLEWIVGFDTQILIKYLYIFPVYIALYKLINHEEYLMFVIKFLRLIFILNAILAISGLVLDIELFRSYSKYRFGFNGFIPAQNEATMFFMLGLLLEYYRVVYLNKKGTYVLYLLIIANALTGTKGSWLFLLMLAGFHVFRSKYKLLYLTLTVLIISSVVIYFVSTPDLIGHYVYNYQKHGLWTTLFSGRDLFIEGKLIPLLKEWTPINYLFGGQEQTFFYIEMDFIDLFLYFGIFGFFIYLYLIRITYFSFALNKAFFLFVVVSIFLIASLAGHFFSSALNSLYLALVCLYFKFYDMQQVETRNQSNQKELMSDT